MPKMFEEKKHQLPVCVKIPQSGRKYGPAVKIKIPDVGVMSR